MTTAPTVKSAALAKAEAKSPQALRRQAVKDAVERYRPVIADALPPSMNVSQFASSILTAVRKNPDLLACEPNSIIGAALQAAQLGLTPNDGRGLCSLIPYGGKASFQMEYRGAIELARRSGLVRRFVARTVYEGDEFDYAYGTDGEHLTHKPTLDKRGKAIYWYAIAWDAEGQVLDFVVLTRDDVEYHRSFSKQKNGKTWTDSYNAMACKSAVWDLMKLLPRSVEVAQAIESDGRTFTVSEREFGADPDDEVVEATIVHAEDAQWAEEATLPVDAA